MTDEADYPSRKMEQFVVRLPDGMRKRIKAAADANSRSMNAEIVATLEEKYPPVPSRDEEIMSMMADLMRAQKEISRSLDKMVEANDSEQVHELGVRYKALMSHHETTLANLKMLLTMPKSPSEH